MNKLDDWKLEELKQNLPDYAERFLTKSKRKKYCCPACGSGTKNKMTGALGIHKAKDSNVPLFTCRSCGATGNIYQLVMLNEGLDFPSALKRVRELYDPSYNPFDNDDDERTVKPMTTTPAVKPQNQTAGPVAPALNNVEPVKRDFRNYYKIWNRNIRETNYPNKRGLNDETVKRFNLGYAPEWTSPTGEETVKKLNEERKKEGKPLITVTPSPRLIIPVDANHYTARDTRPDDEIPDWQKDYKKVQEGKDGPLFNEDAMNNALCFFVVEGEIDAMSIEQAGGSCVALRSTGNTENFCNKLKSRDTVETGTVIIALDNDQAGKKAGDRIEKFCKDHGFLFTRKNVSGQYKDPNEYLCGNPKEFYKTVQGIIAFLRKEKMIEYAEYNSATAVKDFMNRSVTEGQAVPTGFKKLDNLLNGGLCSGLVFIGGLSSIGKTTLALNMAENIAMNKYPAGTQDVIRGRDVLYFALEQSKNDLISKILSRRTYLEGRKRKKEKFAKMNFQLLQRDKWTGWEQDEWDCLWGCYETFKRDVGNNLYIIEPKGDMTARDIVRMTEKHIQFTGRTPIVFVDYLQILKSIDERATDKQAIDRTLVALGSLAREHHTTVVGISSFNRENYWQKVNLTAFKDSGNLEYSADMLFAIAPAGMTDGSNEDAKNTNKQKVDACRDATEKDIQLHVLKTRSGIITGNKHPLFFTYYAKYNHFEEADGDSYLSNFDDGNPQNKRKRI